MIPPLETQCNDFQLGTSRVNPPMGKSKIVTRMGKGGCYDPPLDFVIFSSILVFWCQMKAFDVFSTWQKKFLKKVNFLRSYSLFSALMTSQSPISPQRPVNHGFSKNDRKKVPNARMCYKMISYGENTPNKGILVHVRAFFTSKTSIFRLVDANNPPVTYFETMLNPYL